MHSTYVQSRRGETKCSRSERKKDHPDRPDRMTKTACVTWTIMRERYTTERSRDVLFALNVISFLPWPANGFFVMVYDSARSYFNRSLLSNPLTPGMTSHLAVSKLRIVRIRWVAVDRRGAPSCAMRQIRHQESADTMSDLILMI